ERSHVALVLLERREDRAQLEIGAGAARGPVVHLLAERRVPQDRAVRDIEEPGAQLRRGRSVRQCRGGRDHRVEQRQAERDAGALENRAARQVLLRDVHGVLLQLLATVCAPAFGAAGSACSRNASLRTTPWTISANR